MLDWVKIWRVRRPIGRLNTVSNKLSSNLAYCIDSSIVLLEDIARVVVLISRKKFSVKNFEVGVSTISMLLRLEISVHNIEASSSEIPKACLDYNFHILMYVVRLYHPSIPFLPRSTKHPFGLFTSTLLYRTFVTLYIHSLLLDRTASS